MKLSISTTLFYGNHIFDVLDKLKGFSFDGLELRLKEPHFDYNEDREIEGLKKRVKKEGLEILSLHAPSTIDISSCDEWERVRSVREVEKAIVIANRLGAGYVVVHPGETRTDTVLQLKMVKESVDEIVDFSMDWHISILLENTQPGRIGDDPGELLKILSMFKKSSIGCCLDTSHLNLFGVTMSNGIKTLGDGIKEIHTSDNFGENDDHLVPYKGKVDWEDFLKGLRDLHFDGIICFELMAQEDYVAVIRNIEGIYKKWQEKLL